jgi:hypothetical protein
MTLCIFRFPAFLCFILLTIFSACQREFTPKLPASPTISSKDPKALAAAIKVWHGTRVMGTPPVPAGTSLQLDATANPTVKAFAGRYATILPEVISGDVQGYYVGIAGSGQYFKVDYTKPRNINGRVRAGTLKRNSPFIANGVDSTGGNVDSALVIVLPANINVPDTFCITYCAYDSQGNISQPVTTCIIVSSLGGDANSGWINGTWKLTSSWEANEPHDTIIFNKWIAEGSDYVCAYDSSTNTSFIEYSYGSGQPVIVSDSVNYKRLDLAFAVNGAMEFTEAGDDKLLLRDSSTCQRFKFSPVESYSEAMTGAWSFNSATNKITMIFETDGYGTSVVEAWEYDVVKVNNTHFIMIDNYDPAYPYYMRLQK